MKKKYKKSKKNVNINEACLRGLKSKKNIAEERIKELEITSIETCQIEIQRATKRMTMTEQSIQDLVRAAISKSVT